MREGKIKTEIKSLILSCIYIQGCSENRFTLKNRSINWGAPSRFCSGLKTQ